MLKSVMVIPDRTRSAVLIFSLGALLFLTSCSIRRLAVDASGTVISEIQTAYMFESDVPMAHDSFPSILKIAEGMYRFYPASPYYSGKLCFLYTAYTFAFIDETPWSDFDEHADAGRTRMLSYYKKAYVYGTNSMEAWIPGFNQKIRDKKEQDKILARLDRRHVETLFWMDFAWAMLILNNTADPQLVLELEIVKKIADRIEVLDPSYLYGSVYAVILAFYGGRTAAIGGNPALAQNYFDKAMKYSAGKSLIPDYVWLRYVATQTTDKKSFEEKYKVIKAFDPEKNPEFRFINEVIRLKTEALYKKKDWLF